MLVKDLFQSCINVILPMKCISCSDSLASWPLPICQRCKNTASIGAIPPIHQLNPIEKVWSCRYYDSAVKNCLKEFKYRGNYNLLPVFKEIMLDFLEKEFTFIKKVDLVVPVPMHPFKRYKRGFNQSELIADLLCSILPQLHINNSLIKIKHTKSQTGFTIKERIKNLNESFAVIDRLYIVGKTILLVDDVITTGATLRACAQELSHAGARKVFAFTLARTP